MLGTTSKWHCNHILAIHDITCVCGEQCTFGMQTGVWHVLLHNRNINHNYIVYIQCVGVASQI